MERSVLVTGASSGIGLATAQLLAAEGWRVFAGARRPPAGSPAARITFVPLDVTNGASVAAAAKSIAEQTGASGLNALVNNAGIAGAGPLEFARLEDFRAVFDVNVFGVVAVTQAVLPLLHRARGRIVNIGSVGGFITMPFGAALCASKHAIEAVSDALRLELWASGIRVSVVQPAAINSGAAEKLADEIERAIAALPPEGRRRYAEPFRTFGKIMLRRETAGSPPEVVARAVLNCLRAKNPPARRVVGKDGAQIKFIARRLPDVWRDAALRKALLGAPGFGSMPASPSE